MIDFLGHGKPEKQKRNKEALELVLGGTPKVEPLH